MSRLPSFLVGALLSCGIVLAAQTTANAQHHHHDYHDFGHHHHYDYHHHHHYPYYGSYSYPYYSYYPRLYDDLLYRVYYQSVPPVAAHVPGDRCRIEVRLPVADAEVLVDGNKTTSVGLTRVFESPELKPGKTYSYQITASWSQAGKTVRDERTVTVIRGRTSLVDFTRPASPERLAAPAERDDK